jgi:hypothetical protein
MIIRDLVTKNHKNELYINKGANIHEREIRRIRKDDSTDFFSPCPKAPLKIDRLRILSALQ